MKANPKKIINLDIIRKMKFLTLNASKTPKPLIKNKKTINKMPKKMNKTILTSTNIFSPSNFNSNNIDRTRKIIFPNYFKNNQKLENYYTNQNSIENKSIRKKDINDIKDFKKSFTKNIFTNYYDINNNNYFLNLYDTSTSVPIKYKDRNSILNNKNFNTKNISRNLKYKDNSFNKSTKNNYNNYFYTSMTETNSNNNYFYNRYINNSICLPSSDTKKMLNNYRNKLLKEFLKYLKKFYFNYYKNDFIYFINELKKLKKKNNLKKFIYSKKIQKQPFHKAKINKKESSIDALIKNRKIFINKKINRNSYHLTERKMDSKNIVSKIINNLSNELVDGKIRNIFLDSSFLNEANSIDVEGIKIYTHQNSSSIDNNHSYTSKKHRILLGNINPSSLSYEKNNKYKYKTIDTKKDINNYREIKINFNQIGELKDVRHKNLTFDNKINIRYNYITFQGKKKNNINNKNNIYSISNSVDSFSIISISKKEDKKNQFSEGRKKYFRMFKNNRFLSSIKEEDEKYSLSIQDSISVENTKIFNKDNLYNAQYKKNKIKLKAKINDYCKKNYKKLLLIKLKYISLLFKENKTNKSKK